MNRQEALGYLVSNADAWDLHSLAYVSQNGVWWFERFDSGIEFCHKRFESITEQDWIEAKGAKDMEEENTPEVATHTMKREDQSDIFLKDIDRDKMTCAVWDLNKWVSNIRFFIGDNITEILRPTEKWKPEIGQEWKPKLGMQCEMVVGSIVKNVTFVGLDSNFSYVVKMSEDGEYKSYHLHQVKFRPLKTQEEVERDELISIIDSCNMSSGVLADIIISAGYKK